MLSRWLAFLVWALVAASAVAWGLRLAVSPPPVPADTVVAWPRVVAAGDLTPLFGVPPPPPAPEVAAAAAPPPERSRFQLVGVVAPASSAAARQGVALIGVDGKMPRTFRVGAAIDGELALLSVQQRVVAIGPRQGPASITLELPPLPPAATGVPVGATLPVAASPSTQPPAMRTPFPGITPPTMQPTPSMPPQAQPGAAAGLPPGGGLPAALRLRALRPTGSASGAVAPPLPVPGQPGGPVVEMPPADIVPQQGANVIR